MPCKIADQKANMLLVNQHAFAKRGPAFDDVPECPPRGCRDDLLAVADQYGIKDGAGIVDKVGEAVNRWQSFAKEAEVPSGVMKEIGDTHLLKLSG